MTDKYLIITKDGCKWCVEAKAFLDSQEMPYVEVNITNDEDAKAALKRVGWRTVPIIVPMGRARTFESFRHASLS